MAKWLTIDWYKAEILKGLSPPENKATALKGKNERKSLTICTNIYPPHPIEN